MLGRSGLLVLLIILPLTALALVIVLEQETTVFAGILELLLGLAAILALLLFVSEQRFNKVLVQLSENASRIRRRESLLTLQADRRLSRLDQLLQAINRDTGEFQRKEQAVINHALDVICSVDHKQIFQSVNPAAARAWGYAAEELIGKSFSDILLEEDRQSSLQSLFGAENSIDTLSFENRVRRKNGSILHVLWSAHWSATEESLFCVAHDITARKLSEKLLEESEQRIRQIFEDMPVGLIMSNKLGLIEMCNPALNSMCNCRADELIGKHIQVLLGDLVKYSAPPDWDNLATGLAETVVWRKSGGFTPVNVKTRRLTVGAEKKYLLVLLDTTEREKLEELKREFFAMVSHDLRSPLTSMLSVLDLFAEGKLGELNSKGKELIGRNLHEVERLIKIVDELLDIEKMKSGKFVIDSEYSPADSLIESAIASLEHFALRRNITIEHEKSGLFVFADSSLMIRVLVNLLSNAVKFSPPATTVRVGVCRQAEELLFSVKDRGRGIPEEYKQRIFDKYEQVETSGSHPGEGTGLGLPICRLIVEQHGGRIWVESPEAEGSNFLFTIPCRDPEL